MLRLIQLAALTSFNTILLGIAQIVQSDAFPIRDSPLEISRTFDNEFICFMETDDNVIVDLSSMCERAEEDQVQGNLIREEEHPRRIEISELSQIRGTSFRQRLEVFCGIATPQEMGESLRDMCERLF